MNRDELIEKFTAHEVETTESLLACLRGPATADSFRRLLLLFLRGHYASPANYMGFDHLACFVWSPDEKTSTLAVEFTHNEDDRKPGNYPGIFVGFAQADFNVEPIDHGGHDACEPFGFIGKRGRAILEGFLAPGLESLFADASFQRGHLRFMVENGDGGFGLHFLCGAALGVKVDRGHVLVNEWLETGVRGLYAIGDLVGPPWLAHKASHEGVICVEKIAGLNSVHAMDVTKIPGCTYSNPQIASVGLTEAKAKERGFAVKVGRFPVNGNGKAIALGEPEGMVKTVFDAKTGELLGAHMIGAEVTELIQGYGLARTLEATEEDLFHTIFPHPTLSEMMHESVLDAYGRVIHT